MVVESIVAGHSHVCALKQDGSVYCWGSNGEGQLGIDSTNDRWVPTKVLNLPASYSLYASAETTCALTGTGLVTQITASDAYCWGSNQYLAAGITAESRLDQYLVPEKITAHKFISLSLHRRALCGVVVEQAIPPAVNRVQRVRCIGGLPTFSPEQGDGNGQNGTYASFHDTSASFGFITGFSMIRLNAGGALANGNVCALHPDKNRALCWGQNKDGSLGRGYSGNAGGASGLIDLATPKEIYRGATTVGGITLQPRPADNLRAIAAGYGSVCAISSTGSLACTGAMSSNADGYLATPGPKFIIVTP